MAIPISFTTGAVLALCLSLWVIPSLLGWNRALLGRACMSPTRITKHYQIYRAWTSVFAHAGFFHILFNMLAWYFLNVDYENRVGSLISFYNLFIIIVPIATLFHVTVANISDFILRTEMRDTCAVGISGVLFALLIISLEDVSSVSIFGFFDMSSFWYPIALAIVLQLFSPGLSFLGHLSGIVAGHILTSGYLSFITLSSTTVSNIESKLSLRQLPHWRTTPDYLPFFGTASRDADTPTVSGTVTSARQSVSNWFSGYGTRQEEAPTATRTERTTSVFTGTGNVVGGQRLDTDSARAGIPAQSRLLAPSTPTRASPSGNADAV